MTTSSEQQVAEFLSRPVPATGTDDWRHWEEQARSLGASAAKPCIEALKTGEEPLHYAALLVLRLLGYEARAQGFDADQIYFVRPPGTDEEFKITPEDTPDKWSIDRLTEWMRRHGRD